MVVALEIPPLPKLLPRFGVERRRTVRTKVDEDASTLNHRSGCCIAVHLVAKLWFFILEDQSLVELFTRLEVKANGPHFLSVDQGIRHPDHPVPHNWRRPCLSRHWRFPDNVGMAFIKYHRQIGVTCVSISVGTTKLIPIVGFCAEARS